MIHSSSHELQGVIKMAVIIRWLGHSGFQITSDDETIYIDIYRAKKYIERVPDVSTPGTIIISTHGHSDHCHPESIESVTDANSIIIGPENCAKKITAQFEAISIGEEKTIRSVSIKAVHAYNIKRFRAPGKPFHPKGYGVGFLITISGVTIYHAGDTDLIPEMEELGSVDVALLPVGDTYTMDNEEAGEAALKIKPRLVVPMHTWDKGITKFVEKVKTNPDIEIIEIQDGDEFQVD